MNWGGGAVGGGAAETPPKLWATIRVGGVELQRR
jgi:hypothetical protein